MTPMKRKASLEGVLLVDDIGKSQTRSTFYILQFIHLQTSELTDSRITKNYLGEETRGKEKIVGLFISRLTKQRSRKAKRKRNERKSETRD